MMSSKWQRLEAGTSGSDNRNNGSPGYHAEAHITGLPDVPEGCFRKIVLFVGDASALHLCSKLVQMLQYQQVIARQQCHPPNIVDGLFGGGLLRGVLEFLPPADLAAAAMAYPPSKDLVRSLHHDEERHYIIQASRIHKCIKILQDTDIDIDGNYDKITVPDGGIALGEWVLIMNDDRDNWHDEEAHLDGYSGVAVKCVQNGGVYCSVRLACFLL